MIKTDIIKKYIIILFCAVIINGMYSLSASAKFWDKFTKKMQSETSETVNSDADQMSESQAELDDTDSPTPRLIDKNRYLEPYSIEQLSNPQNELTGGENPIQGTVKAEEELSDDLELKSETVDFYPETRQYLAKGKAELIIKNQKTRLSANEIIIDQKNYSIIGIGNVKINKDNDEYFGDYIKIDTKKESSFLTRPILYFQEMTVVAKTASMYASNTFLKDGDAIVKKKSLMVIQTSGFGGVDTIRFFDPKKLKEGTGDKYRFVSKKITVKREEEKNNIYMQGANIYLGKTKIAYAPRMVIAADKDVNYVETIIPEMGNRSKAGMYIAPSVVIPLPKAAALKAGPMFSLQDSRFGVGAFARFSSPNNRTEAMYSGATGNLLINGRHKLGNNIALNYAVNDYMDNAWMGEMMPYYGIELSYDKENSVPQANTYLKNKVSAGIFKDVDDYDNEPHTTIRYRWLAEAVNQAPLFGWKNYLMLGYRYQHELSLYQTGDLTGVARIGPRLYSDLGRLYLELDYFASGQTGESPFYFDRYRYGKNNVVFRGQWYINKYISLAYLGSSNLSERDQDGEWLTENQFIIAVGTDDIKLRFGFDTVRNSTTVGLDLLLGTNKTLVEFDEMKVEDFDTYSEGKASKEERKKSKKKKQENKQKV